MNRNYIFKYYILQISLQSCPQYLLSYSLDLLLYSLLLLVSLSSLSRWIILLAACLLASFLLLPAPVSVNLPWKELFIDN